MWCDKNVIGTPFEIVGYMKNADYIITDTFHGCAFFIKFQKAFASIIRESNKNKMSDLLIKFGLTDHLIDNSSDIEKILSIPIDKNEIKLKIRKEQKKLMRMLCKNLIIEDK